MKSKSRKSKSEPRKQRQNPGNKRRHDTPGPSCVDSAWKVTAHVPDRPGLRVGVGTGASGGDEASPVRGCRDTDDRRHHCGFRWSLLRYFLPKPLSTGS